MRKFTFLFSILLFSMFSIAQDWVSISDNQPAAIKHKLLHSTEDNIAIQFQISGFYTTNVETPNGKAQILSVPKMVSLSEVGAPDLPKFAVSAIIGDQALMQAFVVNAEFTDFENMEIAPSKGDFSRKIDPASVPYTYGEMYTADSFYPTTNVSLQTPYILRNFRGQALTLTPFVYNPVTKTLRVYHQITIEMQKIGTGGENQFNRSGFAAKEDREFKYVYGHHFINYTETQSRYPILEEQGNLLIISHGPFMAAMQPFVEWKKTIGRPTEIFDVATIGSTPAVIKDFVTNYYNTNGLTHLLLVGDHQQVPSYNNTSSGGYSDNYYGYLAGNDSYNELFVGRFSAENATHVQTQVQKIITYERDLDENATWLNVGTGVARNEGAGNGHNGGEADYVHMDYIRDSLLNYTYATVHREYDGGVPGVPNTNAAQISQRINSGTSVINYCNHGSQNSWSVANYSTNHVNALTNTDRWPIVWAVACDNGRFTSGDCFAETWMRATHNGEPTGALGTMMSWISQPWQPPMTGQDEMVTILVEGYNNNIKRTFGGNSINGSMKMIDLHGSSGRSTHDTWILFGDPSLTLRTAPPTAMTVSHMPAIFLGMNEFTVNADAEDAIVSLTIDGEIIGTGVIQSGSTTITFPALNNVGMLKIAVFGYNKITYIEEIEIIPASGPFLAYVSNLVNGVSGGQVHYGSDVSLGIQLKNLGIEPASNINVTLTSASSYVTITDGTESYGTMQPDEVVMIENAFAFVLSDEVPNNTPLPFTLTIVADEDNWESSFSLTALAPEFSIGSYSVFDPTGNSNGRLDPGETADIKISFSNTGLSQAMDALGSIAFNSPFITVNTASFDAGTIAAGESVEASFNISVSGGAPIGSAIEFGFNIEAGAYNAEKTFTTKIGLILEDFETGNFAAFPWTFGGNLPWVITNVNPYEGTYSAKSGTISHNQSSQMIIQYEVGANDSISFFRKVSSESGYDYMRFYIDNVKVGEWAGNIAWSKVSYPVASGMRTFKWEYMKDISVSSGDDCAWVDYITLPPAISTSGWAGNDASICSGETHQLDGSATHYSSVEWTTSGTGTFSNAAILNPVYSPSETDIEQGSIQLTLSVHGGSTTIESSLTLNINHVPEVFAGETSFTCVGAEFELTQSSASGYTTLQWTSSGTGAFSDAAALHPTYIPSEADYNAGIVYLTLEAHGIGTCGNSSSETELHFHALPTALLSGDQLVCEGGVAELTLELSGTAPWTIEMAGELGNFDIPSSPFTLQMYPQENTTYTLINVVDANNCVNFGTGQAVVELKYAPAQPSFIAVPDTIDHAFVTSSEISIEAVSSASSYVYMIEPAEAGTISANGTTASIAWNSEFTGTANLAAAAVNDCGQGEWSEAVSVVIKSTVGITEKMNTNVKVYPNPTSGRFTISLDQLSGSSIIFKVSNVTGELVFNETRELFSSSYTGEINLEKLPNGVYVITVQSGSAIAVQRITIQN